MTVSAAKPPRQPARLSHTRKPPAMDLSEWQTGLRRQFAVDQKFIVRNLGPNEVFSEYAVTNPQTRRTYRVAIRGVAPGVNYCSCPDYAVNTLGTCKHIEYVLHGLNRRHAKALARGYEPPFAEVYVRYGPQRFVWFSPGASCPASLRRLAAVYFESDGRLREESFEKFDAFLRHAARIGHELRVYDDARAIIAEVHDAAGRRRRLDARYGGRNTAQAWKALLNIPLYPYQREGALFAAVAGRAIIADDMGLGKTMQAIAATEILARECGVERVLVICPASLKYQWKQEIERSCKRPICVIEGTTHARAKLYAGDGFYKVANYDVIHRDLEAVSAWRPDVVILDEAQRIKNWQTRSAKTVKQIGSPYAFVLTGTPLENRLDELHSIVEFVDRHRLGPLFAFKAAHEVCEEGTTRVVGYRDLNRIKRSLAPILIRRTKDEVLKQLPPRMDKNFFVPMTDPQWEHHDDHRDTVARLVAKWRRFHFLSEADQLRLRIALQYMRMSCDSTYLIDQETRHGTKVEELSQLLGEIFEDDGAKVVIFSQWVRMNRLVEEMLTDRGWGYVHLHGGVPSKDRKDLMRALKEDRRCRVFLSTDAGGVGLNLQSASAVVNLDLPWNPAVLEQRIGRVHRMGQTRPVRVVNYISEGTIEHGMLSLLSFKRSMFTGVLDSDTDQVSMGEGAMKRFMRTVETATTTIPDVAPTPIEPGPPADETAEEPGSDVAVARSMDARTLGDVFAQCGAMLETLGRSLLAPGGNGAKRPSPLRIETDPASGKPELRIALPEPDVLRNWIGQFVQALGMARPPN